LFGANYNKELKKKEATCNKIIYEPLSCEKIAKLKQIHADVKAGRCFNILHIISCSNGLEFFN
jgi:hypothetical protein